MILKSFKSLKESAQNKVLNENEKISIPFDSLPNAQKEYISDFFSKSNGSVPQSVSFSVSRTWNGIPRLVMQWGMFVRGSIGGTPFQNKWQNELMDRWIIEGDSKVDPLGEFDKAKEMSQDDKKKDILDSVFQWARLNNINIIGHCSIATSKYQPIQGKITMAKVLGFFNNATFMHKWRGNTLLISSIQWFIKDSKNCIIDYNMLEYIKKQEPLKITDIIHISKTLNENQAKELDFRFPDLIKVIENQREELQFLAGNRTLTQRLLQPQGTPLNSASRGLFDAFHVFQVPSGTQAVRLGLGKQAFAVIEFLGGRGQVLETWPH